MNEGNIDWILAIACFLAGIGIGALCYHLLNANVARNQKVRQRLAQTELELNQVKDSVNDHFAKAADLAGSIHRQSEELQHHLAQGAGKQSTGNQSAGKNEDDPKLKPHAGNSETDESAQIDAPQVPRDYADGAKGTLAEDYGMRRRAEEPETASPPRY